MSTPAAATISNETTSPASSAAAGTFEDQTPRSESTAGEWIVVEGIGPMTKKVREKKKVIMEPERKMDPIWRILGTLARALAARSTGSSSRAAMGAASGRLARSVLSD